jgi:hypothetical protein
MVALLPGKGGLERSSLHASTEGGSCELVALVLEEYESGGDIKLLEASEGSEAGPWGTSENVLPSECMATKLRLRDMGLG